MNVSLSVYPVVNMTLPKQAHLLEQVRQSDAK